jgi:6-phosphogluconolactonase
MAPQTRVYNNSGTLARAAAERIAQIAEHALSARGRFIVCLAGGSTPRATYEVLAAPEYGAMIDWTQTHVFFGDERCVPPTDRESNYRTARDTLLSHVPVSLGNVHRIHGEMEPPAAAEQYEREMREFFQKRLGQQKPRFDLLLLGMGTDGHTASLFPGTPILREKEKWVAAHRVEKLGAWRVSLTFPALNAAANVLILVTGKDKSETLYRVFKDPPRPDFLPVQGIQPEDGSLIWMLDEAANSKLDPNPPLLSEDGSQLP